MGGKPEGDFNGVKTDYTDDFKFGEVWLAVKDKKLYKYCDDVVDVFDIKEGEVFAEEWELTTGNRYTKELKFVDGKPTVEFDLEAIGEKVFVFATENDSTLTAKAEIKAVLENKLPENAELEYELDEANVCVLDFAKWRLTEENGKTKTKFLKLMPKYAI